MEPSTDRIKNLWTRMQALYGSRWALEYGECASQNGELNPISMVWARTLEDIPNERLAHGLKALLARESEHPPSLPEFSRLCGAKAPPAEPRTPLDPAAYAEIPASRCAALAATLAERAGQELAPRLERTTDHKQRAAITRAYWMTRIGAIGIGKMLARTWKKEAA